MSSDDKYKKEYFLILDWRVMWLPCALSSSLVSFWLTIAIT